ncbi:hypothetical protein KJ743_03750 [Patescibacteria group bacterium]|nr:hypothetical protein [Patescibacteria group bacterium]
MLFPKYNFNPFFCEATESYRDASAKLSEMVKWIEQQLKKHIVRHEKEPAFKIGQKIKQFQKIYPEEKQLVEGINRIVELRNAFQHGENSLDGDKLFIKYGKNKIELTVELFFKIGKDYDMVYGWFVWHQ